MDDVITEQPQYKEPMSSRGKRLAGDIKRKVTTRDGWLGDFDFKALCMPQLPFGNARKARSAVPFYGLNDDLPLLVMLVIGFQHSLAMLAGVITPPIIFASALSLPAATQSYMISASLIASGITSMIQMSRIHIWRNYYLGTGLITVTGTSFASLAVSSSIFSSLYANGTCPTSIVDGVTTNGTCPDAYGALLGTFAVTAWMEMLLSLVPPAKLKKIFPPAITGVTVMLIGASLIGDSGVLNWGGGSSGCHARPETGYFSLCTNITSPHAATWGSPKFIGLGFLSFITIVLVEIFGSGFMKNASIIIGLIVGMIVAGAAGYVDSSSIGTSPAITFLWTTTFKLRVYGPAILPAMAVYIALALEAIGDITASSEASRQPTSGLLFDSRIQGGVLADGLSGLLSALMTVTPMSIFAQNNGVITLTRCANRKAGYVCASLLIIYGIIGKIAGVFLSIPPPVLGGVTTFLFATVMTSGIRVLSTVHWGRKVRFVIGCELAFGFGNLLVSDWLTYLFLSVDTSSAGLTGFLSSITIILSTPYLSAFLIGVILWNSIPDDVEEGVERDLEEEAPVHADDTLELGKLDKTAGTSGSDADYDDIKLAPSSSARVVAAE